MLNQILPFNRLPAEPVHNKVAAALLWTATSFTDPVGTLTYNAALRLWMGMDLSCMGIWALSSYPPRPCTHPLLYVTKVSDSVPALVQLQLLSLRL